MKIAQASSKTSLASSRRYLIAPGLGLGLLLVGVGIIYSQAWSGAFYFDDQPNLHGLSRVQDLLSALDFITSGIAGTLGRPVALATFALQAGSWPDPRPLLIVNTIIHLFNTVLVFLLAWLAGKTLSPSSPRLGWFALAVAACWSLSPFLASSSLLVIQRMATLSATFVYLGLIGYFVGRFHMETNYQRGLIIAGFSLLCFTLLAAFTKENGALLPAFALLAELTLFRQSTQLRRSVSRSFSIIFLWLPTALIAGYLMQRGTSGTGYASRDFTIGERLLTQARAVWDYLYNLLIPNLSSGTPFADDFVTSTGLLQPPSTIFAIGGVLGLLAIVWLARGRAPLVSFGIGFFIVGHSLESTVIPLELYFAHRNYLPAFGVFVGVLGPLFFLDALTINRRTIYIGLIAFVGFNATILTATTSLWGKPALAAEIWEMEQPESLRATQNLIMWLGNTGRQDVAVSLIDSTATRIGFRPLLYSTALGFCHYSKDEWQDRLDRTTAAILETDELHRFTASAIVGFAASISQGGCEHWTTNNARQLLDAAWQRAPEDLATTTTRRLLFAETQVAFYELDFQRARFFLDLHRESSPSITNVRLTAISFVLDGQTDAALAFLEDEKYRSEGNPLRTAIRRSLIQRDINDLLDGEEKFLRAHGIATPGTPNK